MKEPVFRILGDALGDMLYPDDIRCMVCGRDIPVKNRLCLCRDCVLPENAEFCLGCGRALLHGGVYCDVCQREKHTFAAARAPLVYEDAAKTLIRRLKYGNARYLAPYLGSLMAETWLMSRHTAQAVAFVPMHRSREGRTAGPFCRGSAATAADLAARTHGQHAVSGAYGPRGAV